MKHVNCPGKKNVPQKLVAVQKKEKGNLGDFLYCWIFFTTKFLQYFCGRMELNWLQKKHFFLM